MITDHGYDDDNDNELFKNTMIKSKYNNGDNNIADNVSVDTGYDSFMIMVMLIMEMTL